MQYEGGSWSTLPAPPPFPRHCHASRVLGPWVHWDTAVTVTVTVTVTRFADDPVGPHSPAPDIRKNEMYERDPKRNAGFRYSTLVLASDPPPRGLATKAMLCSGLGLAWAMSRIRGRSDAAGQQDRSADAPTTLSLCLCLIHRFVPRGDPALPPTRTQTQRTGRCTSAISHCRGRSVAVVRRHIGCKSSEHPLPRLPQFGGTSARDTTRRNGSPTSHPPPPPCGIPSGCCFFSGPWTLTRSSLRVGSLRSVGRCGRCSCWRHFRVRGAQWLVCRGCAGCGGCRLCGSGAQQLAHRGCAGGCCGLPSPRPPSPTAPLCNDQRCSAVGPAGGRWTAFQGKKAPFDRGPAVAQARGPSGRVAQRGRVHRGVAPGPGEAPSIHRPQRPGWRPLRHPNPRDRRRKIMRHTTPAPGHRTHPRLLVRLRRLFRRRCLDRRLLFFGLLFLF